VSTQTFTIPAGIPTSGPWWPGSVPLTFGDVAFNSEECPAHLPLPVVAKTVVSELVGGGRVVQSMGPQPQQVTFSGTFWNVNVATRVALLRSYCVSGIAQSLTWGVEAYTGILSKFEPTYQNVNRCDYSLTIEIINSTNGALTSTTPVSVDSQVAALQSNATTYYNALLLEASDMNDPQPATWQANWNTEQLAIQQNTPLSQIVPQTAQAISNTIMALTGQIGPYITSITAGNPTDPRIVPATQFLNTLTMIGSNVTAGQANKTVQIMGGSLATVAARYYGDVSLTTKLMQANGLATPQLSSGILSTIILPPFPVTKAA
jgi:hypothetical protein